MITTSPIFIIMPAADLVRLKSQIDGISWLFTRPAEFRRAVNYLLEYYSDRTFREGKATGVVRLMESYRVPGIVLRQMRIQLGSLCQENPSAALETVDALWQDEHLEVRVLAAGLLGQLPLTDSPEIENRIQYWISSVEDRTVKEAVLTDGLSRLKKEAPQRLLELAKDLVTHSNPSLQSAGLQTLLVLIKDPYFENLPAVFSVVGEIAGVTTGQANPALQNILYALAQRSPNETAFFLHQLVTSYPQTGLPRFLRRCLPGFPEAVRRSIKPII